MNPKAPNGSRPVPRFFSIATVAAHLDVSQKTVRRWIAAGELMVYQIGGQLRISEPDLAAFLARARRSLRKRRPLVSSKSYFCPISISS